MKTEENQTLVPNKQVQEYKGFFGIVKKCQQPSKIETI